MLDTAFLLIVHMLLSAADLLFLPIEYDVSHIAALASPIICLGYVAIGWKCGATVGMRICGAKIVREDGGNPDFRTVILRFIGFILACLPIKMGLLPIIFDSRRQGWHDRIASTLVVKSSFPLTDNSISELPKRSLALPTSQPIVPDFSIPWRGSWLALPLYIALGIAMTWPIAAHLSSKVMGYGRDPYIFIWNYWWFKHAIDSHISPLHTNMIFFPRDVSLSLHTMQWFNCLLAYPMQRFMNLIAVYNTLNIVSVTLSAFCGYWMIASIVKKWLPALVVGIACGFAPYFSAHLMGHPNLVGAEFIYLYFLCAYAFLVSQKARYAVWSGLWMALSGLCDLQYFAFCFLVGAMIFIALWLTCERPDRNGMKRRILLLAGSWLVAGVLLAPVEISAVQGISSGTQDRSAVGGVGSFRADLKDWMPNFEHFGQLGSDKYRVSGDIERTVRPGYVLLILAAIGAYWRGKSRFRFWALLILFFVILASGPYLTIYGNQFSLFSYLALGFPGSGFDLIWKTQPLWNMATMLMGDPLGISKIDPPIVMPYSWLPQVLPLLKPLRVPARYGVIDLALVSILAAFGMQFLLGIAKRLYGRLGQAALSLAVLTALVADFWMAPFVYFTPLRTDYLKSIKHDGAVIEIPCQGNEYSAYYQTVHHDPLFRSFISRAPHGAVDFVRQNIVFGDIAADNQPSPRYRADFEKLRALGARYAIVRTSEKSVLMAKMPSVSLIYSDPEAKIYRIDPLK